MSHESKKPPDLNDMFLAGLELRDAVRVERAIKTRPEVNSEDWWRLIYSFQQSDAVIH